MVSKYRSLVKKSTAVKLKASDYVGLPNQSVSQSVNQSITALIGLRQNAQPGVNPGGGIR